MRLGGRTALIALLVAAISAPASAQDSTRAADYFARAQSAEKRQDWRAAIRNYEQAYVASPHPNVLYNIGLNYERLGERRQAATYLLRYLQASPRAGDAGAVRARIETLRQAPSQLELTSVPPGATIYLDGTEIGQTPLTVDIAAGPHTVYAVQEGVRSQTRQVMLEYGEPVAIGFRVGAEPGRLSVEANVGGAEIRIDGTPAGRTPYSAVVPAGKHSILISAEGYRPRRQVVVVPPRGSEQIRAELEPLPETAAAQRSAARSTGFLVGFGAGLSTGTGDGGSGRFLMQAGIRAASTRWDLVASYGSYGAFFPTGISGEFRFYIAGRSWRPYLRGSIGFAVTGDDETEAGGYGIEGGLGLQYLGRPDRALAVEYFVEANMQLAKVDEVAMSTMDPAPALAPLAGAIHLQFPITFGVALRFGGGGLIPDR